MSKLRVRCINPSESSGQLEFSRIYEVEKVVSWYGEKAYELKGQAMPRYASRFEVVEDVTVKLPNGTVRRYLGNKMDCKVYYGMVVEHKQEAHQHIVKLRDIVTKKEIAIDTGHEPEATIKVVYIKPTVKVIIEYPNGKRFTGTATCHKDDIFIPQVGYDIAWRRAKIKQLEAGLSKYTGGACK